MKKYIIWKSVQLALFLASCVVGLIVIFRDRTLYGLIASNPHIRLLCILLWVAYAMSFIFLFIDFSTYTGLKREYSELDLAVYSDPLTGIANRYSCDVFIEQYLDQPLPKDVGCITFDMTNLQAINAAYGHRGGNDAIKAFSLILQEASVNVCFVGRNGGNKFLAAFQKCSRKKMEKFLAQVEEQVIAHNRRESLIPILYRSGTAFNEGEAVSNITELIALSSRRASEGEEKGVI